MNNYGIPQQRNQFMPYFNPTSGASASTNNIVWVQGIEGAKAWQLSPNSMVILLDSEVEGKMYIKVSDNIGMSSLRIFNYTEEIPTTTNNNATVNNDLDLSQFVKKDELGKLIKDILDEQSISTTAPTATTDAVKQPKIITVKKQQ
jgi:hypothetical protein